MPNCTNIASFRSDNKQFLQIALSEESIIKRRRKNKVNIQMTGISWLIEFGTGMIAMAINIYSKNPDSNDDLICSIIIVDACLNFILIPSSYLVNNEVNKTLIIAEGWCRIFKRRVKSNKVNPSVENANEAQIVADQQQAPICTISGNVRALGEKRNNISLDNFDTDWRMLMANHLFYEP